MRIDPVMKVVDKGCNLGCDYCFYCKQKRERKVMDLETLEKAISEICGCNSEDINFVWHGGEPLLAGIDFYRRAFELQKRFRKPNQKINNSIQTNATLINGDWAALFREYGINIGVSLDGPKEVHDRHRIFPNGSGSFERVMKGIRFLQRESVEFSVISVITPDGASKSEEIFYFLISQRPLWINFVSSMGVKGEDGISFEHRISLSLYIDFLIKIFDLWIEKGDYNVKILPIETIISGFLGRDHRDYRLSGECKKRLCVRRCERNLVITPDGEVKTCGFHGYGDLFVFGNIKEGLIKAVGSSVYQKYKEHLDKIKERCGKCEWYKVCYEGCPRDFYIAGEHGLDCSELHRFFQYIQNGIRRHQIQKEWR